MTPRVLLIHCFKNRNSWCNRLKIPIQFYGYMLCGISILLKYLLIEILKPTCLLWTTKPSWPNITAFIVLTRIVDFIFKMILLGWKFRHGYGNNNRGINLPYGVCQLKDQACTRQSLDQMHLSCVSEWFVYKCLTLYLLFSNHVFLWVSNSNLQMPASAWRLWPFIQ